MVWTVREPVVKANDTAGNLTGHVLEIYDGTEESAEKSPVMLIKSYWTNTLQQ